MSAPDAAAAQVSRKIDEEIERERKARKKQRGVRLLLLGQSESGELVLRISSHIPSHTSLQANQRP